MEELVRDLQKQIRTIRLNASIDRQQGHSASADVMDDVASAFERIMLKYTQPAPLVPGYPRTGGWRVSAYNMFSFSHKA